MPKVIKFKKNRNTIIVEYEYWDDGHAESDNQNYFMFDISIQDEYGFNYPSQIDLVVIKTKFIWATIEKCQNLSVEIVEENDLGLEFSSYKWGDKEIEELVDTYFPINDSMDEEVKQMLIDKYKAHKKGLPKCIPLRLKNYFQEIIDRDY